MAYLKNVLMQYFLQESWPVNKVVVDQLSLGGLI